MSVDGTRKKLQANTGSPSFTELASMVGKTTGVTARLGKALDRASGVRFAALFGSVAKRRDTAESDIDILLVSDHMTQEEAFSLFGQAERAIGRKINPTTYTSQEFTRRRRFLEEGPLGSAHRARRGAQMTSRLENLVTAGQLSSTSHRTRTRRLASSLSVSSPT